MADVAPRGTADGDSGPGASGLAALLRSFNRHRTLANLALLLMILAGVLAWPRMRTQFFPDVIIDTVQVGVGWPGAGAADVDAGIVQLLLPALAGVEGVVATDATAREGQATVRLEFEPGYDMERAAKDVTDAVAGVANLPADAGDPAIRAGGWSERVTDVVIAGPVGLDQLARLGDEMVARLYAGGVTRATILGVAAPSVRVEVAALSLVRHDITLAAIADAIGRGIAASPAGDIGGLARIRTGEARRTAAEIAAITLRRDAGGATLTVGDVATVTTEGIDRDRAIFVGSDPAVQIRVDRGPQGDAIAIQDSVERAVAEMAPTLPAGVTATLVNAQAEQIAGRVDLLVSNGLQGLVLVVLMLFLFLNARTAIWVAAGIPVATAAGIAVMYLGGLSINMMSLFAMILMLGIVVDDAIVVSEYADFRVNRLGEPPVLAAENAALRMIGPVFSAMITMTLAFAALFGIGGRFGDLIADIPFTVIAILVASLVECFLILPHHLSHAITLRGQGKWYDAPSRAVNRGFDWFTFRLYRPFIALVVRLRYPVMAGAVLLLASQVALVIRGDIPWRFYAAPEQASISGGFAMLPAATRADSMAMLAAMQNAAAALGREMEARDGVNPILFVTGEIGGNAGRTIAGAENKESWQLGGITVQLVGRDLRPYSSSEFVAMLQERVQATPMTETVSFRSWGAGPGGDAIDIQLSGADADTLKAAAEALKDRLSAWPEVTGLEDSLAYDKDEMVLTLTPQGEALGLTIADIGTALRQALGGIEAATFPDGTRTARVTVALPDAELTADFLDRMLVATPDGQHVALTDVVTVAVRGGFSTIGRENGEIVVSVTGGLSDGDPDRAAAILSEIAATVLPGIAAEFGTGWALSGLAEQEQAFLSDALNALLLSLFGIYLTLSWIFGSWTRPLVIMSVMPFGLVGAIWGHLIWDLPMTLFTVVGVIGMVGIIVNDSIVLVSTIDEYRPARGLRRALVDASSDRLRAVFLTTATSVIGLAPMLFEASNEAEFLKPTVVTLVYGLGFGMFLVLLVVPSLTAILADVGGLLRAARRAMGIGHPALRLPVRLAAGLSVGAFCLFILPLALTGAPWPAVAALLPGGFAPAFAAFAATLAGALALTGGVAALVARAGRRAAA